MIRDLVICGRVFLEMLRVIWFMRHRRSTVTIFGSARFPKDHPYCQESAKTGALLANAGYQVLTGGGPSIMEAANRGAFEAKGRSIGVNIVIPFEQRHNPYLNHAVECAYFFTRKFGLIRYSCGFIIFPGGMGTIDELAEVVTLIQTGKRRKVPVVLVNRQYWSGFLNWLETTMVKEGALRPAEFAVFDVVDTADQAVALITKWAENQANPSGQNARL